MRIDIRGREFRLTAPLLEHIAWSSALCIS